MIRARGVRVVLIRSRAGLIVAVLVTATCVMAASRPGMLLLRLAEGWKDTQRRTVCRS